MVHSLTVLFFYIAAISVAFAGKFVWFYLSGLFFNTIFSPESNCHPRDYGNGATVCVCSEKYKCDNLNLSISKVPGVITSYATNKVRARFSHREYQFAKQVPTTNSHFNVTIEINRSKKFQKIIGFGGAFTDSTGINIAKLSKSLQSRLIEDYFGVDGLEYRLNRIPIAGTDFR